jgi:polyisoprenoid-binding protein YceI
MKNSLFVAILLFSFIGLYAQKQLSPSAAESKVHFVIKNFAINTGGDFSGLQGEITFNGQHPASSVFNVTIATKTVHTNDNKRDKHLRSDAFFDVDKFPLIRLKSSKIETGTTTGMYVFTGELTIKDVIKTISFPFKATAKDAGYLFEGDFEINRLDYHVGGESATMSEKVKLSLSVFAK